MIRNARDILSEYNIDVSAVSKETSPTVELSDVESKILALIPQGDFITDDEILDAVDDVAPHELPQIMIELEIKGCIVEDAGRYTRKFGG